MRGTMDFDEMGDPIYLIHNTHLGAALLFAPPPPSWPDPRDPPHHSHFESELELSCYSGQSQQPDKGIESGRVGESRGRGNNKIIIT
jgi:hypothetical protein